MTYIPKTKIQFYQDGTLDAFYRQRVSEPYTIFDSKLVFDSGSLSWDYSGSDGGDFVYEQSGSSVKLTTTSTIGSKAIRQTKRYFNYQPGKSQLIVITGICNPEPGIRKRTGYFDENNGLFFESSGSEIYVVKRFNGVDTKVSQSDWNIDKMDGTGNSKTVLDQTKSQIRLIDFEWLGVGRVRFGGFINGEPYYSHEFAHGNELTSVYMQSPNLPIRSEIENLSSVSPGILECICSSIVSEGGQQETGIIRYASTSGTHVDIATENTLYAIVGIRLKSNYVGTTVKIVNNALQIVSATDKVEWVLVFNPTIAGTFNWQDVNNSAVQYATGSATSTVTGGYKLGGGFLESGGVQAGSAGSVSSGLDTVITLGKKIDGTLDTMILCARPIAGSSDVDVEGSITWKELS